MKKLSAIILMLSLMLCMFAGCKKTPEDLSYVSSDITTNTVTSETQETESTISDTAESDVSSADSSNNTVVNNNNGSSNKNNSNNSNKGNNSNNINNSNDTGIDTSVDNADDDIVEWLFEGIPEHEGITYSDKKTAKDTDTVSMKNIYVNMGNDIITEEYRELDTWVMTALNDPNSPEYLNMDKKFLPILNDYRYIFKATRGYDVNITDYHVSPEEIYYRLYIYSTWEAREEYNAQMQNNSNVYANEIKKAIDECGIYKGMLQKDAIVKINEWICNKVEYDYDKYNAGLTSNKLSDFFERKLVTCGGYAQVFELMCRSVGIDAQYIGGFDGEGHAWNVVYFSDGSKYYFDSTFNDAYVTYEGKKYQKIDRCLFVASFATRRIDYIRIVGYGDVDFVR